MNLSRAALYRIVALLTIIVLLGASASQAISEELGPDGWYISVGVGANRASTMKQAGHNRDTTCYPTRDCRYLPDGMPAGYRWFYDLSPDAGIAFELTEIFVTHRSSGDGTTCGNRFQTTPTPATRDRFVVHNLVPASR